MKVYADNAATTRVSRTALHAMLPYFDELYGNPSSLHSVGQRAAEALYEARETIAKCLGAEPREIYFTSGGSESDNQAIISAAEAGQRKNKKHIISTAIEHHAVMNTLKKLERQGFEVTFLDVPENGIITPEAVAEAIRPDTALVTVMYANNEIGTIQPIAEIGAICRERGVIFHSDAVQAAGHIDINVVRDNVDMLSISSHKFRGPKGVGALYVRRGVPLSRLIEGGEQERGRRPGTENIPGIVGMAAALYESCEYMNVVAPKIAAMRDRLIEGLSKIPHSILNGDPKRRLPGNVNFCFEGIEGEAIVLLLDEYGIQASSGSACASGSLDPSHVLIAIGRPHEIAHGSLRLTLSEENTQEEVDYILEKVPQVVEHLRNMSPVWRDLVEGKREYVIQ
ncbi:MAG: cysteine desulfurase NifS [Clostridiales bacterium]|nr:cysteine desulfurase NifS [Clostridiales bacterium]